MINCQRLNKHIVTVLKEHLAAPVKHLPVWMDRPQSSTTTWLLSWQKQASWIHDDIHIPSELSHMDVDLGPPTQALGWVLFSTSLSNAIYSCATAMPRGVKFQKKKIVLVSYGNNMKRRSNEDGLLLPIQTTYGANWMKIKCVYIHLYVLPPFQNTCLSFVKI